MRLFKKTACVFFTLAILIFCLSGITVSAADSDMRYGRKLLGQMANSAALQYAYDQLDKGMQSGMPSQIDLTHSTHKISVEEFTEYVFPMFYADFPEYFWLKNGGYSYQFYSDNTIATVSPAYLSGISDLAAAKAAFDAKVNQLISGLTGSDYDKAKALHDRLCEAVDYTSGANDQSAYGALVEGKAVCAGYTKAYQHLLLKVGIPAWYVRGSSINPSTGKNESHGWNLVKLDGQWYYTDVTWDDQRTNTYYTYFNITTQQLLESHAFESHYTNLVPSATATAANYFVKENLVFTDYDQDRLVDLLKQNNNKVQIYIDGNPDAFQKKLNDELLSLGRQLGGTGAFRISFSTNILGKAMTLSVNLQSEGHTHAATTTVPAVEATCLTGGQKAYYICNCGVKFLDKTCTTQINSDDQLNVPAKEHTPVWKQDIADHWKACSVCGSESAGTRGTHTDSNRDQLCDICNYSMPTAQPSHGDIGIQAPDNSIPTQPNSNAETQVPTDNTTEQPAENGSAETRLPDSNTANATDATDESNTGNITNKNEASKRPIVLYVLGSVTIVGIAAAAVILSIKRKT